MITRFRLEGTGKTREECVQALMQAAEKLMEFSGVNRGLWKCTDDVVERAGMVYRGRMVFKAELYPKEIGGRSA